MSDSRINKARRAERRAAAKTRKLAEQINAEAILARIQARADYARIGR